MCGHIIISCQAKNSLQSFKLSMMDFRIFGSSSWGTFLPKSIDFSSWKKPVFWVYFLSSYKHRIYFKLQGILFCCSSSQNYVLGIFPSQYKTQICIELFMGGRVSWVMNQHPLYNVPSIDEHLASFHCFD